jgi:hypothetical protein
VIAARATAVDGAAGDGTAGHGGPTGHGRNTERELVNWHDLTDASRVVYTHGESAEPVTDLRFLLSLP